MSHIWKQQNFISPPQGLLWYSQSLTWGSNFSGFCVSLNDGLTFYETAVLLRLYLQFFTSLHTSGFWKQTVTILEFYFRFRFHVIVVSGNWFCVGLPHFILIGPSMAELWRRTDFQDGGRVSQNVFGFSDITHLGTSKSIGRPNFGKLS